MVISLGNYKISCCSLTCEPNLIKVFWRVFSAARLTHAKFNHSLIKVTKHLLLFVLYSFFKSGKEREGDWGQTKVCDRKARSIFMI